MNYTNTNRGTLKPTPPISEGKAHTFKTHHTLKVLPPDEILVMVQLDNKHQQITGVLLKPTHTWKDIMTPNEMEKLLLEKNKRHLQQTIIEGGRRHKQRLPNADVPTGDGD
jgi:hypothetical protein